MRTRVAGRVRGASALKSDFRRTKPMIENSDPAGRKYSDQGPRACVLKSSVFIKVRS
jgi:hypothetical protein